MWTPLIFLMVVLYESDIKMFPFIFNIIFQLQKKLGQFSWRLVLKKEIEKKSFEP
jgi:hypothetical protein